MRTTKSKSQLFFEKTKKWYFDTDSLNFSTRHYNVLIKSDEFYNDFYLKFFKPFYNNNSKFKSYSYFITKLLYKSNAYNINMHFIILSISLILFQIFKKHNNLKLNFDLNDEQIYITFCSICHNILH